MSAILARDIPDRLPAFIEAVLLGDSFYSDVPVVIVDPTDTEQRILEKTGPLLAKAGSCGVVLFILPVEVVSEDNFKEAGTGPLRLHINFQTWELKARKELAAGNTKSAYSIARHTFALMKGRTFGGLAKLFVSDAPVIERVPPPEGKAIRGWQVNFTAQEDDGFVTPKVERVVFAPASGAATTVAITTSTSGASIYYTTDGTPPSPTNGTLYTAPITVPVGGFTLFAQGTKADHFPSSMVSATFTKTP